MAILGLLEADIRVNGEPLPEYDNNDPDEIPQDGEIIKYVKVPTGASFSIRVSIPREYNMTSEGVRFKLWIDGKETWGALIRRQSHERSQTKSYRDIRGVGTRVNDSEESSNHMSSLRSTSVRKMVQGYV